MREGTHERTYTTTKHINTLLLRSRVKKYGMFSVCTDFSCSVCTDFEKVIWEHCLGDPRYTCFSSGISLPQSFLVLFDRVFSLQKSVFHSSLMYERCFKFHASERFVYEKISILFFW